jgi:hypothetical protein
MPVYDRLADAVPHTADLVVCMKVEQSIFAALVGKGARAFEGELNRVDISLTRQAGINAEIGRRLFLPPADLFFAGVEITCSSYRLD